MKRRINITIEAQVVEKAHELGLNVSKTCENALKEAIRRLETPVPQTEINGGHIDSQEAVSNAKWCSGRDLNPGRRLSSFLIWSREAVIHGPFHV